MTIADLELAYAATRRVLSGVTADQHGLPTPCASWTVRDLVDHVVLGGHFRAERLGVSPSIPDLRDADLVEALDAASAAEVGAFSAAGALDRMVELPFGTIPASVFVDIATGDVLVHGWDLATATGQSTDLAPDLASALRVRVASFLPESLRGPDGTAAFDAEREAPADADAATKLAAFLGRVVV